MLSLKYIFLVFLYFLKLLYVLFAMKKRSKKIAIKGTFANALGRPRKNNFNALRFKQLYNFVHQEFKLSDNALSKRMIECSSEYSLGNVKGWLSFMKKGNFASTSPLKLWLLAKALCCEKYQDSCFSLMEITQIIVTKLHASVSRNFLDRGSATDDDFALDGYNFFSSLLSYDSERGNVKYFLRYLDLDDICIDFAELLTYSGNAYNIDEDDDYREVSIDNIREILIFYGLDKVDNPSFLFTRERTNALRRSLHDTCFPVKPGDDEKIELAIMILLLWLSWSFHLDYDEPTWINARELDDEQKLVDILTMFEGKPLATLAYGLYEAKCFDALRDLYDKIRPKKDKKIRTLRLVGTIPPELWNRLGTKVLPKLKAGSKLQIGMNFKVSVKADAASSIKSELNQILDDLGLTGKVVIEES